MTNIMSHPHPAQDGHIMEISLGAKQEPFPARMIRKCFDLTSKSQRCNRYMGRQPLLLVLDQSTRCFTHTADAMAELVSSSLIGMVP